MPVADDSLLSASTSSSNISPSRSQSHNRSLSPSPNGDTHTHTSASRSPSTPAIDPDAPLSSIASSAPPSPPSTADGSDAHLTDAEFAAKMDDEVLRLGEVTEWEAKMVRREEWLAELRSAAQGVKEAAAAERAVKVEDGEETEQDGKTAKGEAAFLRQSHRYLSKQLKSLEGDDWMFASDGDVNTRHNQDRLFVPATKLNMAAGKEVGWGSERGDGMEEDASMEIVGQDGGEVWGRGGGGGRR